MRTETNPTHPRRLNALLPGIFLGAAGVLLIIGSNALFWGSMLLRNDRIAQIRVPGEATIDLDEAAELQLRRESGVHESRASPPRTLGVDGAVRQASARRPQRSRPRGKRATFGIDVSGTRISFLPLCSTIRVTIEGTLPAATHEAVFREILANLRRCDAEWGLRELDPSGDWHERK